MKYKEKPQPWSLVLLTCVGGVFFLRRYLFVPLLARVDDEKKTSVKCEISF